MSLHYLVKLEMLIGHVLPLGCYSKKLQNLFHLNYGPQICNIWIRSITTCGRGTIAIEGVQNTHHVWSEQTETATENGMGQAGSCRHCGSHLLRNDIVDSSRSVMRVLYTISCNISYMRYQLDSKLSNFENSWGGINSWVSFCNNSTVARSQWAFQVSQGSVETLFRWGGKLANLFRRRCT